LMRLSTHDEILNFPASHNHFPRDAFR
jgi:hypothetical protein